jgi:hypothetical protein
MMDDHLTSCLLFSLTKELLKHGFETLLKETIESSTVSIKYSSFIRCIIVSVDLLRDDILQIITRLLKDFQIGNSANCTLVNNDFCEFYSSNETVDVCQVLSHSKLHRGIEGRSVVCTDAVNVGIPLLQTETPYAVCLRSRCGCGDKNILVEHLDIAKTIFESRNQNLNKFQYFMRNLCTGMLFSASTTEVGNLLLIEDEPVIFTTSENPVCSWNFHKICLMAVYSVLFSMKILDSDVPVPNSEIIYRDSVLFFNILLRLPLNVHGISAVVENSCGLVESCRLGYAVYLIGSAINHSCQPNCIVRYNATSRLKPNSTISSVADLLKTRLEVISLRKMVREEEITISYGPIASRNDFKFRQQMLIDQYLFRCRCSVCTKEICSNESLKGGKNIRYETNETRHETLKILCQEISDLEEQLVEINICLTELVLKMKDKHGFQLKLNSFEQLYLTKIQEKIEFIGNYFAVEWNSFHQMFTSIEQSLIEKIQKLMSCKKRSEREHSVSVLQVFPKEFRLPERIKREDIVFVEFLGLYCFYLNVISQLKAEQLQYKRSSEYLFKMIALMVYIDHFPEESVEINREFGKLSSLYFNLGMLKISWFFALKASNCFQRFLSSADVDRVNVEQILRFCAV